MKHTNFKNALYNINLKDILEIFIANLSGVFSIFFLPILYMINKIKNKPWKKIYYLFPVITFYITITLYFTRAYWLTYNIYPVAKSDALVFLWGVVIFHGILEEGLWIILSFYFINIFLYLYDNFYQTKDILVLELKNRFNKLKKAAPLVIFILLIAAIIESMDLGICFK